VREEAEVGDWGRRGDHNDGVQGWGGHGGERERESRVKRAELKISMG
jgi:hypothetical protein